MEKPMKVRQLPLRPGPRVEVSRTLAPPVPGPRAWMPRALRPPMPDMPRRPGALPPRMLRMLIGAGLSAAAATVPAQEVKGNAEAARQKISMCIGCHAIDGYRTSYPTVYAVPKINGQTVKYIENSLNAYRSGDRSHSTMRAIAGSLTDQDIADLAAYYGKPLEGK